MRFPVLGKTARASPDASMGLVSRRSFFGVSVGTAGAVLGSGLWTPARSGEHENDDDDGQHGMPGARCPGGRKRP